MRDLFNRISKLTDTAELFGLDSTIDLIGFENNRLKSLNTLASRGVAIRAVKNGTMGQAYASDLRNPDAFASRVAELAVYGDPPEFEFADAANPSTGTFVDASLANMSIEALTQLADEAIQTVRNADSDALVHFLGERTREQITVLTSRGADFDYERVYFTGALSVERVEGRNIVQLAKYHKGIRRPESLKPLALDLAEDLALARTTQPLTPGKLSVILAPSALADVLMAFTGSIDAEMVARKVSPLHDRLNQSILDPRISIWDDPLHPDGIFSAPIDDEGTVTRRKAIIERGVLREFIGNRKSCARIGIAPTGNGFRLTPFDLYKTCSQGVGADVTNMVMEPGSLSIESLRNQIGSGIEVHQINGILLGDLISGDFTGSLEVAYRIDGGKRVGRIKDAMISGNFFEIFRYQLIDLSLERLWSGTFGGCSGAFLLPYVGLEGIDIAGA